MDFRHRQCGGHGDLYDFHVANLAVIWSGTFNFLGVLVSTGAVAFGIISLLPVELILQVSSGAGFAMVFALLIAAIYGIWALGISVSPHRAHTP